MSCMIDCGSLTTASQLAPLLLSRRWQQWQYPFPHVTVTDTFQPELYRAMEQDFLATLHMGLSETFRCDRFSRRFPGYDAYGADIPSASSLALFVSRAWHNLLAQALGVSVTGDMHAELHHHRPGSGDGFIHNDLNPGWFPQAESPHSINLADRRVCNYRNGKLREGGVSAVERIRAVAMIFYLANGQWHEGDGGETALYLHRSDKVGQPSKTVPPRNNCLVAFECTPFSFHTFLSNRYQSRNSLVVWLHRTKPEALSRWSARDIVGWRF